MFPANADVFRKRLVILPHEGHPDTDPAAGAFSRRSRRTPLTTKRFPAVGILVDAPRHVPDVVDRPRRGAPRARRSPTREQLAQQIRARTSWFRSSSAPPASRRIHNTEMTRTAGMEGARRDAALRPGSVAAVSSGGFSPAGCSSGGSGPANISSHPWIYRPGRGGLGLRRGYGVQPGRAPEMSGTEAVGSCAGAAGSAGQGDTRSCAGAAGSTGKGGIVSCGKYGARGFFMEAARR